MGLAKSVSLLILATFSRVCVAEEIPQSTHPVWSPDGTHIAYINNSSGVQNNNPVNFEIFTKKVNGGDVKRHTFNTAFEADISWSPDNTQLAFKSYRDGNDEVYTINLKDGRQTNISENAAREDSPFWSKMEIHCISGPIETASTERFIPMTLSKRQRTESRTMILVKGAQFSLPMGSRLPLFQTGMEMTTSIFLI